MLTIQKNLPLLNIQNNQSKTETTSRIAKLHSQPAVDTVSFGQKFPPNLMFNETKAKIIRVEEILAAKISRGREDFHNIVKTYQKENGVSLIGPRDWENVKDPIIEIPTDNSFEHIEKLEGFKKGFAYEKGTWGGSKKRITLSSSQDSIKVENFIFKDAFLWRPKGWKKVSEEKETTERGILQLNQEILKVLEPIIERFTV